MAGWPAARRSREPERSDDYARHVLPVVLDLLPDALCLSTPTGRAVHTNTMMRRLTRSTSGAALSQAIADARRAVLATERPQDTRATRVVTLGAVDYLVRAFAVRATRHGSAVDLILYVVRALPRSDGAASALKAQFGLTTREAEVANLLARGVRNDELARSLGVTPFTARRHTERVLAKLGVGTRAAAAALLARVSIIDTHVQEE